MQHRPLRMSWTSVSILLMLWNKEWDNEKARKLMRAFDHYLVSAKNVTSFFEVKSTCLEEIDCL